MNEIHTKRVYEPADPADGLRVLVDRVWPRGLSKEQVHADLWLKEAAPSTALRKWFGHDPARWEEFKRRYFAELDVQPDVVALLMADARLMDPNASGSLTLLYSARDAQHNQAVALREYLLARADR